MDELLRMWKEAKNMEDWTGQDGHDSRLTLSVIEKTLKALGIKIKEIND